MIIPKDVIIIWPNSNASIPSGFTRETSLDSLHPKSTASSVDPGTVGGNYTHTHTSPAHTHTMVSHNHTGTTGGYTYERAGSSAGDGPCATDNHSHTYNISGVSGGNLSDAVGYAAVSSQPPYYEVIYIRASISKLLPATAVILHSNSTIPAGYHLCNGDASTPDLRNTYLKGAGAGNDAGGVGGTVNHQHSIAHTHTGVTHSHSGTSAQNNNAYDFPNSGENVAVENHTHTISLNAAGSETGSANSESAGSADTVEPVYKKLIALQNISGTGKIVTKGMIALWLGTLATIPQGWFACDGNNGTVDLTSHFVKIGVDDTEIGNTGGSNTHTHAASNSHTHTAAGSHSHTGSTSWISGSHPKDFGGGGIARSHDHTVGSSSSNTSSWGNATVTGDSANNEPPYLTASYIQFDHAVGGGGILAMI